MSESVRLIMIIGAVLSVYLCVETYDCVSFNAVAVMLRFAEGVVALDSRKEGT